MPDTFNLGCCGQLPPLKVGEMGVVCRVCAAYVTNREWTPPSNAAELSAAASQTSPCSNRPIRLPVMRPEAELCNSTLFQFRVATATVSRETLQPFKPETADSTRPIGRGLACLLVGPCKGLS